MTCVCLVYNVLLYHKNLWYLCFLINGLNNYPNFDVLMIETTSRYLESLQHDLKIIVILVEPGFMKETSNCSWRSNKGKVWKCGSIQGHGPQSPSSTIHETRLGTPGPDQSLLGVSFIDSTLQISNFHLSQVSLSSMQDFNLLAFIVIIDILKPIPVTWFQVLQVSCCSYPSTPISYSC